MNFKKIILLKQINQGFSTPSGEVRGVARIEDGTLSLSIINLSKKETGDYFLCLYPNGTPIQIELGGGQYTAKGGVRACLLVFFGGKEVVPVAFGSFEESVDFEECISYAQGLFKEKDAEKPPSGIFRDEEEGKGDSSYDDEALATVNYYDFEGEINGKNGQNADGDSSYDSQEEDGCKGAEEGVWSKAFADEDDARAESVGRSYYQKIKGHLDQIFKDFPPHAGLCEMVHKSRWANVTDGKKGYVVGVIEEGGEPELICYGIPGSFSDRPDGLGTGATFIPTSPFALKGEGYWVMYQDAVTGKTLF